MQNKFLGHNIKFKYFAKLVRFATPLSYITNIIHSFTGTLFIWHPTTDFEWVWGIRIKVQRDDVARSSIVIHVSGSSFSWCEYVHLQKSTGSCFFSTAPKGVGRKNKKKTIYKVYENETLLHFSLCVFLFSHLSTI